MPPKRPSARPKRTPKQPARATAAAPGGAVWERIAAALERLAPAPAAAASLETADAFVWHAEASALVPVPHVNRVPLELLRGIDRQVDLLLNNTRHHTEGLPANNALLWGARGTGKSSLVKA